MSASKYCAANGIDYSDNNELRINIFNALYTRYRKFLKILLIELCVIYRLLYTEFN